MQDRERILREALTAMGISAGAEVALMKQDEECVQVFIDGEYFNTFDYLSKRFIDQKSMINFESSVMQGEVIIDISQLDRLNELTECFNKMNDSGLGDKYKAVLEFNKYNSIDDAIAIADKLGDFEYLPDMRSAEDYGKHIMLSENKIIADDELLEYFDYKAYGYSKMAEQNMSLTSYGIIKPKKSDSEAGGTQSEQA